MELQSAAESWVGVAQNMDKGPDPCRIEHDTGAQRRRPDPFHVKRARVWLVRRQPLTMLPLGVGGGDPETRADTHALTTAKRAGL